MNRILKATLLGLLATTICFPALAFADVIVYSEDFTGLVSLDNERAVVGGQDPAIGSPLLEINFGQWIDSPGPVDISGGTLNVDTPDNSGLNPEVRGGGVVLNPTVFAPGARTYTVSFDVLGYTSVGGNGSFAVYQGTDYQVSSNARLVLDVGGLNTATSLNLTGVDGASASLAQMTTFTADGNYSFDFDYDGISAVGLFMGSALGPQFSFDNIVISTIPEPSSMVVIGLGVAGFASRRRRSV